MDPDLEVQEAVRRVFRLYRQLGSIGKVTKYHYHHSLLFPRRVDGAIRWDPISPMQVAHLLTNPNYTDAYVYYRQKVSEADESRPRTVQRLPQSGWLVVHKHHDAYVTWEEWEEIQALLASRRVTRRPPIGNGPALLQGILWCDRCTRWIRTISS